MEREKITLTELQLIIRDRLYEALPGFFWVVAEIAEIKVNSSGHCYLELTDCDSPGGKVRARVRATIWAVKYRSLNALFSSVTGIPLRSGINILFRATVEYHELYGLSLNISDIDPAYTAGDMALRREAVIRRLTEEGVMDMNRELDLPLYPRRIAVISSAGAAGYLDFIRHIHNNSFGYAFETHLFNSVMQGEETVVSVIGALDTVAASAEEFDTVIIIRGGGSTTDLSWFDNYDIAFHITQFPLPVITGIGHEKDLTVADMTAWKSLKTPTAVADFLVSKTLEAENYIMQMASDISGAVSEAIKAAEERLSSLQNHITGSVRLILKVKDEQVGYMLQSLVRNTRGVLQRAGEMTAEHSRALMHLDPANVLKRGFTITSFQGRIIRNITQVSEGDEITTHFEKGRLASVVTGKNRKT